MKTGWINNTLIFDRKSHPEPNRGHLIIRKAFGHIEEQQQLSLTTMNLDLRDPLGTTHILRNRSGKLGVPSEPDGSPIFLEIICNFQICMIIFDITNGSKVMMYLLFGK